MSTLKNVYKNEKCVQKYKMCVQSVKSIRKITPSNLQVFSSTLHGTAALAAASAAARPLDVVLVERHAGLAGSRDGAFASSGSIATPRRFQVRFLRGHTQLAFLAITV